MNNKLDRNEDPITGEPGSHPVGTGLGTAGGGSAGAVIGAVAGPVGAAVGATVGGVVGAIAGHATGEAVNPTAEDAYWRENHDHQDWANDEYDYESDFSPAYRHGYEGRARHGGSWDDAEQDLEKDWDGARSGSRLEWDQAKVATRAGWERVGTDEPTPLSSPNDTEKYGY